MYLFFISLLVLGSLIIYRNTAKAGISSFLYSFLNGSRASAQIEYGTTSVNSQTMPILQAASHVDPNPDKSANISPLDSNGGILVADMMYADIGDQPVNTQISTYIVQKGDTISSVAKMFGVSTNTILWANDMNSKSTLKVGQTLVILPISGITYQIKRGDTIQGIAKTYKADLDDLLSYNDLSLSSVLSIGDKIIIPNVEARISIPTKIVAGNNPAHDTNGPNYSGYYIRPVSAGRKSQGLHGYNGVDIAAPVGTPIYASASGVVIVSKSGGWNGGYGNFITISHSNGTQTLYAHNSKNLVSSGQHVNQGDLIGYVGNTGKSTGPHLHFEIRGAKNPF